ncbi:UNKNOWN [Stylonychia lemnae]|uniref:Uncharacterized protein n=1 Tax=Stylonychia lemnae TaxID=5949 RepID=A0A078AP85_STYLE|nr:UNKNOWN [Stylonychia lemnae]|eukprot:CDW82773.1 UNKNOWN [Stylonychia lemnae]
MQDSFVDHTMSTILNQTHASVEQQTSNQTSQSLNGFIHYFSSNQEGITYQNPMNTQQNATLELTQNQTISEHTINENFESDCHHSLSNNKAENNRNMSQHSEQVMIEHNEQNSAKRDRRLSESQLQVKLVQDGSSPASSLRGYQGLRQSLGKLHKYVKQHFHEETQRVSKIQLQDPGAQSDDQNREVMSDQKRQSRQNLIKSITYSSNHHQDFESICENSSENEHSFLNQGLIMSINQNIQSINNDTHQSQNQSNPKNNNCIVEEDLPSKINHLTPRQATQGFSHPKRIYTGQGTNNTSDKNRRSGSQSQKNRQNNSFKTTCLEPQINLAMKKSLPEINKLQIGLKQTFHSKFADDKSKLSQILPETRNERTSKDLSLQRKISISANASSECKVQGSSSRPKDNSASRQNYRSEKIFQLNKIRLVQDLAIIQPEQSFARWNLQVLLQYRTQKSFGGSQ